MQCNEVLRSLTPCAVGLASELFLVFIVGIFEAKGRFRLGVTHITVSNAKHSLNFSNASFLSLSKHGK